MKTINFFITCLLLSNCASAQTPKSDVVNMALPNHTSSISKQQLPNTIHAKFKRTSIPFDKENYFESDGLVVSFWDDEGNPAIKRSLEEIQSGILGVFKYNHDSVNFSKIIKVNNIRFLIYEYQKDNEVDLRFQSEFNKNNKDVLGVIQFKRPDEQKALDFLMQMLKSMHFKDQ